jgi:hypothetical protein
MAAILKIPAEEHGFLSIRKNAKMDNTKIDLVTHNAHFGASRSGIIVLTFLQKMLCPVWRGL